MTRISVPFMRSEPRSVREGMRTVARVAAITGVGIAFAPVLVSAILVWAYCTGGGDILSGR